MTLRIRAALHSIPYLLLCLVILPWVFVRWLGSGPITGRGVMLGGLLMVAGFGLSAALRPRRFWEPLRRQAETYEEKVVPPGEARSWWLRG